MRTRFNLLLAFATLLVFLQLTMIMVVLNDRNSGMVKNAATNTQGSSVTTQSRGLFAQQDTRTGATTRLLSASLTSTIRSLVNSKSKEVDMENDYFPFVDFHFVWPEIKPQLKDGGDYFMIVLVNSAAHGEKYRLRREGIRKTWGNPKFCENSKEKKKWLVLFSLGKVYDEKEDGAILEESKQYNDLLIGDFKDFYLNNVVKTFMGQLWAYSINPRYILKCDDDVYIRLPQVMDWLVSKQTPKRYYGGAPYHNFNVDRDPNGKWAISKRYFNESKFPPFNAGAFNVLSVDVLPLFFNYVHKRKPFHTDDAYIGIAARDLGLDVVRIDGLLLEDNMPQGLSGFNDCRLQKARGFGHSLEPKLMHMLDERYTAMCSKPVQCS